MSKLIQRQLKLAPELEEALRQLAELTLEAPGKCLTIPLSDPVIPGKQTFHLGFCGEVCVAELRALGSRKPLITDGDAEVEVVRPKQSKLTDLPVESPRKFARRSKTTVKAVTAMLPHNIREQLIKKHSMTILQLCKALRIEPSGGNRQLVLRTLKGMKDVVRHGVKNSTWNIKVKKVATRTIGGGPKPSATSGQTLERKVEDKPIAQHITLARVDGCWRALHARYGNEPVTGVEAAEVWGVIEGYAVQLLRHMCYLGCADNLPKADSRDPRKFFLVGDLNDPTRDLLHRTNKNGAATSEPPPTVTKRPSIGAAIRARRAKA